MACFIYNEFNDLHTIFFLILLHCLHISGYLCLFPYKNVECSESQFNHSGKCILKCICPKALFSKIHLPEQAGKYFSAWDLKKLKKYVAFRATFPG